MSLSALLKFSAETWPFYRLEVVASIITRLIEIIERRRDIERQMETLVNQVAFSTQVVEGMMKAGFKSREDNANETRY